MDTRIHEFRAKWLYHKTEFIISLRVRRLQDLKVWRRVPECVDNQERVKLNLLGLSQPGAPAVLRSLWIRDSRVSSQHKASSLICLLVKFLLQKQKVQSIQWS